MKIEKCLACNGKIKEYKEINDNSKYKIYVGDIEGKEEYKCTSGHVYICIECNFIHQFAE